MSSIGTVLIRKETGKFDELFVFQEKNGMDYLHEVYDQNQSPESVDDLILNCIRQGYDNLNCFSVPYNPENLEQHKGFIWAFYDGNTWTTEFLED